MTDPAFFGARSNPGLELWRIEALKPVKITAVTGSFYVGDSYILLVSTATPDGKLTYALHFWEGSETSLDEAGVAAYKTVELDDSLGGSAKQYREVEGEESALFLSYFKKSGGIKYVPGGCASGFHHVVRDVWETQLLHLKGRRTVRVRQVPIARSSLNKGDVFILDAGLKIFIFNGPTCNKFEKAKGIEVAQAIDDDERGGRAEIVHLEDDVSNADFWGPLGGFVDPNSLPEGEADAVVTDVKPVPKLFKISDGTGAVQLESVSLGGGKLTKSMLESDSVFFVHSSKLYIWVGKTASLAEKREATAKAKEYLAQNGLPPKTAIERLSEGNETAAFKSEFAVWAPPVSFGLNRTPSKTIQQPDIDVHALLQRKAAEDVPVDDGSGTVQVWVVHDFKLEAVDPAKYGQFYGGDSYVVQYTYLKNRTEETILYFWLGHESSVDEKGAAALLTKEKDDALGGRASQVRIVQGKEPSHFRTLFKGRTIIHKGGKASGFKNRLEADSCDTDGVGLFHVQGTTPLNTHGLQVAEGAASLNSQDTFVLVTPAQVFVWAGAAANADEKSVATNIASILAGDYNGTGGREIVQVAEGGEPEAFWAPLGGKGDYPQLAPGKAAPQEPRLFQASNATGVLRIEEIASFDQTDLIDEDVFLLDTFTSVFVWIGSGANESEKAGAVEFAGKYVAEANDGRDPDIPVIRVLSGQEPSLFTTHFIAWDHELAEKNKFHDPYAARMEALAREKAARRA